MGIVPLISVFLGTNAKTVRDHVVADISDDFSTHFALEAVSVQMAKGLSAEVVAIQDGKVADFARHRSRTRLAENKLTLQMEWSRQQFLAVSTLEASVVIVPAIELLDFGELFASWNRLLACVALSLFVCKSGLSE